MKSLLILLIILTAFVVSPVLSNAQADQQAVASSPVSQPLIREGALAVELVGDLKVGATENEAEAEDLLSAAGIAPHNGWIADYPVTPDIVGELQTAINEAANSGKLGMGKDAALKAFQDAVNSNGLPVKPDTSGNVAGEASPPGYYDSTIQDNYYTNEGPPVVTYFAPPDEYAYMYTWVPYPFWWSDLWYPGFFVLADFNVSTHWRHHGHDHDGFITNHFHDPKTGGITRIDPSNRFHGGTLPPGGRTGWTSPAARSGAQAVLDKSQSRTRAPGEQFRGYGVTQNPAGVRSNAFEHAVDQKVEHAASDRGFQSRTNAGQITDDGRAGAGVPGGRGAAAPAGRGAGAPRGGGGGGFHGGGGRR
ncbi:MAG: hypothetical protein ABSB95_02105 [Dissulfurispiraceae bacterium]